MGVGLRLMGSTPKVLLTYISVPMENGLGFAGGATESFRSHTR